MKQRLHIVALPHTATVRHAYSWCAYTGKCGRLAEMMFDRGHETFLYAGPVNDYPCSEHIPCVATLPSDGVIPEFRSDEPSFQAFNDNAIAAVRERIRPRDVICLIAGLAQAPIRAAFPDHLVCEFGVGYGGIIPDGHHVFESETWRALVTGAQARDPHSADGRFFDAVIPNYYDPADFPDRPGDDDGYLLYVGRLIRRKGVQIAVDTARATGRRLIVAGPPGDYPVPDEPWIEYHGIIGPDQRARLMTNATAVIAPTTYVEPFGGVVAEAQLCGTPAVTTDFGAFVETVADRQTGFRCHTIGEFAAAVNHAHELDRDRIMARARSMWTFDAVAPRYEQYFDRLGLLWDAGFYEPATAAVV